MTSTSQMQCPTLELRLARATNDDIDLPTVAVDLSRRLFAAGLPMTPERAVSFAQALTLMAPLSRSGLYHAARAVFVSDPDHLAAFDQVFASVFERA
jgi:uncharacterized protein with von Willebrand factor type A (vWA) domain